MGGAMHPPIFIYKNNKIKMLDDLDVFKIISEKRSSVSFDIVTTYTDSKEAYRLNRRVFTSVLTPVPPALCFFEPDTSHKETYKLSSFFDLPDPKYSIVPFGSKAKPKDREDIGMSYNVFCADLPIQSYTVCTKTEQHVERDPNQRLYFKEMFRDQEPWTAGHLIGHQYTPQFSAAKHAATIQLKLNFIPEPRTWNCHQRVHIENQCLDNFYGVYPMYSLRYLHGRTVKPYGPKGKKLPHRPIPDGEFFKACRNNGVVNLYMPFLDKENTIYDSSVTQKVKRKIDITVEQHKVNRSSLPENISIEFTDAPEDIVRKMNVQRRTDEKLALAQGNLFLESYTNPLHQAAIIQSERAATLEICTPRNKMKCALIFSELENRTKTSLYLKAIFSHSKILLNECEAEESNKQAFSNSLFKSFKEKFPEQLESIDCLKRLTLKNR
jgi:hypothetical protein